MPGGAFVGATTSRLAPEKGCGAEPAYSGTVDALFESEPGDDALGCASEPGAAGGIPRAETRLQCQSVPGSRSAFKLPAVLFEHAAHAL